MATKKRVMDYILSQIEIENEGYLTYKKVFGKYAFSLDGRIFALVLDNKLYLKATKGGKDFIGNPVKGYPFKNSDLHYVISEEQYDDSAWLSELVSITISELSNSKTGQWKRRRNQEEYSEEE